MEHTLNWFDNTQIWCDNKLIMEFGRLPEWFSIRSRGIWKMVKINCTSKSEFFWRNLFDWIHQWWQEIYEELLEKNRSVKNFLRSFFYRKKEFVTGNLEILFIKFIMRSIFRLKTERESYFVLIKTITLNDKNRFNLVSVRFSSPSTLYGISISSTSYEISFRV